jgi:hypothetical protein
MEETPADLLLSAPLRGWVGFCVLWPDPTSRAPPRPLLLAPSIAARHRIKEERGGLWQR